MLLHPIDTMEGEILPSGAIIFTPMELTVIALARSESAQRVQSGTHSIVGQLREHCGSRDGNDRSG
jgi:hypothetical protein